MFDLTLSADLHTRAATSDDAQAIATIKSAIDRGISLIDTAPAYGLGHAEAASYLARALGILDRFDAADEFSARVALLRQRSRPYLFSNTVAPPIVAACLKALEMLTATTELRDKLEASTTYFREAITKAGLTIKPGVHPIVPIMIGDAAKSQKFAARMLDKGVYVIGFFYPVVPLGTARVRVQVSAAHSREDLEFAVKAFAETNDELKEL